MELKTKLVNFINTSTKERRALTVVSFLTSLLDPPLEFPEGMEVYDFTQQLGVGFWKSEDSVNGWHAYFDITAVEGLVVHASGTSGEIDNDGNKRNILGFDGSGVHNIPKYYIRTTGSQTEINMNYATINKASHTSGNTFVYQTRQGLYPPEPGTYSNWGTGGDGIIRDIISGNIDHPIPENPEQSEPIAEQEAGAPEVGTYTHDWTSDTIQGGQIPSKSGLATGFIKGYIANTTVMTGLHYFLWNNVNFLTNMRNAQTSALECIVGLVQLPFTPQNDGEEQLILGSVPVINQNENPISAPVIYRQYQEINCGSVTVPQFYGTYLDYAPYTDISITLPFVGEKALDINMVMGKTLNVKYIFDCLSGACICNIYINGTPAYTFSGNANGNIPISSQSHSNMYTGLIQSLTGAVDFGLGVTGKGGNIAGGSSNYLGGLLKMETPDDVKRAGNYSSGISLAGIRTPFLTIHSPRQAYASYQNSVIGGQSRRSGFVGNFTGFTVFDSARVDNINATEAEKTEILNLLKSGVII